MVTARKTTVHTLKLKINVIKSDIEEGECRIATQCMERIAVFRALQKEFPNESPHKFHVRVDAGHIKFNLDGYRWEASTPRVAKAALIDFDHNLPVAPHSYTLTAIRKSKVVPMTRDRQIQINEARVQRAAEGRPDKTYKSAIRRRIVGFDLGRH